MQQDLVRKPTLVACGVPLMLAALSQADAQTNPGSDVTWTTGMQQYVQNELPRCCGCTHDRSPLGLAGGPNWLAMGLPRAYAL